MVFDKPDPFRMFPGLTLETNNPVYMAGMYRSSVRRSHNGNQRKKEKKRKIITYQLLLCCRSVRMRRRHILL